MKLVVLYRGPLSSCNYDCSYCPFAKHRSPAHELKADEEGLLRFVEWIELHPELSIELLFTPWGEALVRSWYRRALIGLSHMSHVGRVAVQTNLSGRNLDWLSEANPNRLALWVTYHPSQVSYDGFLTRIQKLVDLNIPHSVGVVGLREHFADIKQLRKDLPQTTYLWVNAYKSEGLDYYRTVERDFLASIDPHFRTNSVRHPSFGKSCQAGWRSIAVDGDGNVRRCHFVPGVLGNLYTDELSSILEQKPCPNANCGCYIGYIHLNELKQREVYGAGLVARIPHSNVLTSKEQAPR